MPTITRSAPAESAASIASRVRYPPPTWIGRLGRSREPLEERGGGGAVERAVEVDHVEPRRALVLVLAGERLRVAAFERDGVATPLGETHDPAVEHVDRRQDLEGAC